MEVPSFVDVVPQVQEDPARTRKAITCTSGDTAMFWTTFKKTVPKCQVLTTQKEQIFEPYDLELILFVVSDFVGV